MSIESNFINELKYDAKKDKIKRFIFDNINVIVAVVFIIITISILYIFTTFYKNNKIEKFNAKIFIALESNKPEEQLKSIYYDKKTPRISKTFAGFNLINILKVENKESEKIYEDIFNNEKEQFFKYYAGLNLLILKIENNKDVKEIEDFIKLLENEKNPLLNFVLEQKALFLKEQGKTTEAKNILESLLKKNLDNGFVKRISQYLLYIN